MTARTKRPVQPRFNLYKVNDGSKSLICRDLKSDQAFALLPQLNGLFIIKFAGFGK